MYSILGWLFMGTGILVWSCAAVLLVLPALRFLHAGAESVSLTRFLLRVWELEGDRAPSATRAQLALAAVSCFFRWWWWLFTDPRQTIYVQRGGWWESIGKWTLPSDEPEPEVGPEPPIQLPDDPEPEPVPVPQEVREFDPDDAPLGCVAKPWEGSCEPCCFDRGTDCPKDRCLSFKRPDGRGAHFVRRTSENLPALDG